MSGRDSLLAIGLGESNDRVLHGPDNARVKLVPTGQFFELRITLGNSGNALVAVLHKSAVKITREEKP
jgi:hypothetical protein